MMGISLSFFTNALENFNAPSLMAPTLAPMPPAPSYIPQQSMFGNAFAPVQSGFSAFMSPLSPIVSTIDMMMVRANPQNPFAGAAQFRDQKDLIIVSLGFGFDADRNAVVDSRDLDILLQRDATQPMTLTNSVNQIKQSFASLGMSLASPFMPMAPPPPVPSFLAFMQQPASAA